MEFRRGIARYVFSLRYFYVVVVVKCLLYFLLRLETFLLVSFGD